MWAHEAVERPGGLLEAWPGALTEWVGLGSLRPGSRADLGGGGSQCPGEGQGLKGPPLPEQLGHLWALLIGLPWGKGLHLDLGPGLPPGLG